MKSKINCDCCVHYVYDDDYECYECQVHLDEDEMSRFLSKSFSDCPYFRFNDEYKTVRRQI